MRENVLAQGDQWYVPTIFLGMSERIQKIEYVFTGTTASRKQSQNSERVINPGPMIVEHGITSLRDPRHISAHLG